MWRNDFTCAATFLAATLTGAIVQAQSAQSAQQTTAVQTRAATCAPSDSAAALAIRERLRQWVSATNRGDAASARDVWAPGLVGWFPGAPPFGDSAAYAAAGVPYRAGAGGGEVAYAIEVAEVAVSGAIAAVHDVWTETRRIPGARGPVRRVIRGSELWRCQPDGRWRIARFVSAPEPWTFVPPAPGPLPRAGTPPTAGRWDLTVTTSRGSYASWLEVERSGFNALVGRFTGRIGRARPVGRIEWSGDTIRFAIPAQWEQGPGDLRLEGRVDGDRLVGTITHPAGPVLSFTGVRAPSLRRGTPTSWGEPVALLNGRDVDGWVADAMGENLWVWRDGVLANTGPGANLVTTQKFEDFRLHAEFRGPKGGPGGILLRGRYWVTLNNEPDREWPTDEIMGPMGGVYGFLVPSENAARAPGEWQTLDVTLVGRRVTVVLNGRTVVADQIIPGLTGSAVDADEGAPGPIMLVGEEGPMEFRNLHIRVPRGTARAAPR